LPSTDIRHAADTAQQKALRHTLAKSLTEMAIDLDDHQCDQLIRYVELLDKWNKVMNLTAVRDPQQMLVRHVLDSLSVLPFVKGISLIDVGAGAGLPGIPLAIAKPNLAVTLIDSVAKKPRFMQQAIVELCLQNANVINERVEEVEINADQVIARAFAPTQKLALLTGHLIPAGGRLLAMMARLPDDQQLQEIEGFTLIKSATLTIPDETAERNIVILQRIKT